jgi:2'-5' RNA ligase
MGRAPAYYRATDRLNAGIHRLPIPQRVRTHLSRWAYRSPPMPQAEVLRSLEALAGRGVTAHVSGGWGVDALSGERSRVHRDLDLVVPVGDLPAAREALEGLGYDEWYVVESDTPMFSRLVLRDSALRSVDVHPVDVAAAGLRFAAGTIGGEQVSCLSASIQMREHEGYKPRSHDRADLRLLRRLTAGAVTALVIPVRAAEPLVDDRARDRGMPAHVTVVYPFLPGRRIDDETERELQDITGRSASFEFSLDGIGHFPGVVYLAPEPSEPFVDLTRAIEARWPDHPPYEGAFDTVVPHVTVAHGDEAPPGLEERLPVSEHATEVWLMTRLGRRWVCRARFALGSPPAAGGRAPITRVHQVDEQDD